MAARASRRNKGGAPSLNEDDLERHQREAIDLESEELKEEQDARAFWSRFNTIYLYAWLAEFNGQHIHKKKQREKMAAVTPLEMHDRDFLLSILVTKRDLYPPPESEAAEDELTKCYHRVFVPVKGAPRPTPPVYYSVSSRSAASSAPATPAHSPPPPSPVISPAPTAQRPSAKRHLFDTGVTAPAEREEEEEEPPSPAHKRQKAAAAPPKCRTCCVPAPSSEAEWLCVCGLRGDLPVSDPVNTHFAQLLLKPSPPAAAAASSSTGQVTANTARPIGADARFETLFEQLARVGPVFPIFADYSPLSVRQAFDDAALAYGAIDFVTPADDSKLVKLIQAGKLHAVGYAKPRRVTLPGQHAPGDFSALSALQANAAGELVVKSNDVAPPSLLDCRDLLITLTSTIIPALIMQPKAVMQWCSLARSVAMIDQKFGWTAADTYLHQTLAERVRLSQPFAPICHSAAMLLQAGAPPRHSPPPAQPQRQQKQRQPPGSTAPQSPSMGGPICRDWNRAAAGCARGAACKFAHVCYSCRGPHMESACPNPRPRPPLGYQASSASSVASSAAAPPPATK
jgi:hypothetical protein